MDRLRPRKRTAFSGFTTFEVEKLEKYFMELGEESLSREFCIKIASAFSRREGRAGKPIVKWEEIQQWLQTKLQESPAKADAGTPVNIHEKFLTSQTPSVMQLNGITHLPDVSANLIVPDICTHIKAHNECLPQESSPFQSQLNEDNNLLDVSEKQVGGADRSPLTEAHAQSLSTQMPALVELNESSHQPTASSNPAHKNNMTPHIPLPSQPKKSIHRPMAGPNLFAQADTCTTVNPCEQTKENPLRTSIKESSEFPDVSEPCMECQNTCLQKRDIETTKFPEVEKFPDIMDVEFEARSSTDGAWYDVERILTHRILCSGEAEVRVRYVGYGAEEDEWVNVKDAVRERSIPVEHWECYKVKVGDLVLCFQERQDLAKYYEGRVVEILRRMHDIRGCRCIFLVRYEHDKSEERVPLRRICCRPRR